MKYQNEEDRTMRGPNVNPSIDNSKEELYIMSQWAMKEDFGRGQELFKHLKNLVKRSETMLRYIYFNHEGFPFDKNVTPNLLRKVEKYENQVKFRTPSIAGLTNSNVTENVLHSKMMISDNQNIYLGSANLGGRCTTRTKELGILITNCPALARVNKQQYLFVLIFFEKIFSIIFILGCLQTMDFILEFIWNQILT